MQGEGLHSGKAAVFVRFSGCNLKCPFCDTDFGNYEELTEQQIVERVVQASGECRFVVFTGGEPALQLTPYLVELLQNEGYEVAVETNGTKPLPYNVDWVTVSPKDLFLGTEASKPTIAVANELKVVFDGNSEPSPEDYDIDAQFYYLQPCDTGDPSRNAVILSQCIDYIKQHPEWSLSMQTQKIVSIK